MQTREELDAQHRRRQMQRLSQRWNRLSERDQRAEHFNDERF